MNKYQKIVTELNKYVARADCSTISLRLPRNPPKMEYVRDGSGNRKSFHKKTSRMIASAAFSGFNKQPAWKREQRLMSHLAVPRLCAVAQPGHVTVIPQRVLPYSECKLWKRVRKPKEIIVLHSGFFLSSSLFSSLLHLEGSRWILQGCVSQRWRKTHARNSRKTTILRNGY